MQSGSMQTLSQADLDAAVKAVMGDLAKKAKAAKEQHEYVTVQLEASVEQVRTAREIELGLAGRRIVRVAEPYDPEEESALNIKLDELKADGRKVLGFWRGRGVASWVIKVMKERGQHE